MVVLPAADGFCLITLEAFGMESLHLTYLTFGLTRNFGHPAKFPVNSGPQTSDMMIKHLYSPKISVLRNTSRIVAEGSGRFIFGK